MMPPLTAKFFTSSLTRSSGSLIACPSSVQNAGDLVAGLNLAQLGRGLGAFRPGELAAWRKPAAWRWLDQAGHDTGDRLQARVFASILVDARDRADQALC